MQLIMKLLKNLPKLHYWDNHWCYGGFDEYSIRLLYDKVISILPDGFTAIETGAGLSTLLFLCGNPGKVITIDPDTELEIRVKKWIKANDFPTDKLEFINKRSELVLPFIANRGLVADICLIDGDHGWPAVFVDFCYMNMVLKKSGMLIIDDVHLPSIYLLAIWLKNMPGWKVYLKIPEHSVGLKTIVFEKGTEDRFLPGFWAQPWINVNML